MVNVPLPSGAPWWAWLVVALCVVITPVLGKMFLDFRNTRAIVHEVKEQTVNNHETAKYPNMRDEITSNRETTERVDSGMDSVLLAVDRIERGVYRLDTETAAARVDVQQVNAAVMDTRAWIGNEATERRKLAENVAKMAQALEQHIQHSAGQDDRLDRVAQLIRQHHPDAPAAGTMSSTKEDT